MTFTSLADWLIWTEQQHPNPIDLGLERVTVVLQRLQWRDFTCPVITLGGTKGKGSCAALLDSILTAAGYRVGVFTSPHLRQYNERIRIAGQAVADAPLCAALQRIETVRGDITLTYFEYNTLAALLLFAAADLDVVVLEVGMGGRLDAVNVITADVAVITSIGLDHCEWLGHDVEAIGREKAGIMRADRPVVFGAVAMPASIQQVAQTVGARLLRAGHDFGYNLHDDHWDWQMDQQSYLTLPMPALLGRIQVENASTVLAALTCVQSRLPLQREQVVAGLLGVQLSARFQVVPGVVEWILDVAHNPLSAAVLASHLNDLKRRRCIAIFAALSQKDVAGIVQALRHHIDLWVVTGLSSTRAIPEAVLAEQLQTLDMRVAACVPTVAAACTIANQLANPGDRIVVFGSFLTVAPALDWLRL